MIITTTQEIPNREIVEILGIVRGGTVRARNAVQDSLAGLKTIVGGEVSQYTKLQADVREQAIERMKKDAERLGADAVVCIRFEVESMMSASVYGTAVKLSPEKGKS